MLERRQFAAELRAERRRLSGRVIRYGEISPTFRERFEPGAFRFESVALNLVHDRLAAVAWYPGGGLTLEDSASELRMSAEIPPIPGGDVALASVRRGLFKGLSVEFHSEAERREGDIRVIERARLTGIGLVKQGAYPSSEVEARARQPVKAFDWEDPEAVAAAWAQGAKIPKANMWATATVPSKGGDCECVAGKDTLYEVSFQSDAFDGLLAAIRRKERDIIMHTGRFSPEQAIASTSRGSLALRKVADGLEVGVFNAAGATPGGRALAQSLESVPAYVRPLIRDIDADFLQDDAARTRIYSEVRQMSLLAKWTPNSAGWAALILALFGEDEEEPEPEGRSEASPARPERRRLRAWL